MLAEGNMSLAEIAAECGFSDQSHFTRTFTHATGIAPGRWRRTHAAAPGDLVLAGGARTNQQVA
jgi:AraC-like DNA-binding protein